jgi:hypothetical protein
LSIKDLGRALALDAGHRNAAKYLAQTRVLAAMQAEKAADYRAAMAHLRCAVKGKVAPACVRCVAWRGLEFSLPTMFVAPREALVLQPSNDEANEMMTSLQHKLLVSV